MTTTTEQLAEALRVALIRLDGHIKQDADGRDGDGANIDDLDAGEAARAALARYDAERASQTDLAEALRAILAERDSPDAREGSRANGHGGPDRDDFIEYVEITTELIETAREALARYDAERQQPPAAEACESINDDDPAPYRVDLRVDATHDRVIAWCDSEADAELIAGALNR